MVEKTDQVEQKLHIAIMFHEENITTVELDQRSRNRIVQSIASAVSG
jgi:hypothetical protein